MSIPTVVEATTVAVVPSFEAKLLTYAELVAAKAKLSAPDLLRQLQDGRAIVRANAALGLAAVGYEGAGLAPYLRDQDPRVASAMAEALGHLGIKQRANLPAIAGALDGVRKPIADAIHLMFAELVGKADAELTAVLDTGDAVAVDALVTACEHAGVRGLQLLQRGARDERVRVRINAVRGVALLGELEQESSIDVLTAVERDDHVSDVRAATRRAVALLSVRCKTVASARRKADGAAPPKVPELEQRELTAAELKAAAAVAPVEELVLGLGSHRVVARINAVRIFALLGQVDAAAVRNLTVLLRDRDAGVRLETAKALGALATAPAVGETGAPELVAALGDPDAAVVAAAADAITKLGDAALDALEGGLETASEPHGRRVAAALGRLGQGPQRLAMALAHLSVDVRANAALGLGALDKARAGHALRALATAAADSNARVRAAAAKALAILEPKPDRAAPKIAVEGFDQRRLSGDELAKGKAALAAVGAAGVAAHLHDANPVVRSNAALALGALAGDPTVLATSLRDDEVAVRLAAAQAIEQLGDAAVAASAADLVRALEAADGVLLAQLQAMLKQPGAAIDAALAHGLETADARHGQRVVELVVARPGGLELLVEAFRRPTGQVHAARGFVLLGAAKLGPARALLEAARADHSQHTRELAQATLRELAGPERGPEVPPVAGFEQALLEPVAFAGVKSAPASYVPFLTDGRAVTRANAATGLGALGAAAGPYAVSIGALLRDDDWRVRVAAAKALDAAGDDAVVAAADYLVSALRGDARVAAAVTATLAPRKGKVLAALVAGMETADETHSLRIVELVCALPNARDVLFAAFDGPAQNVQVTAAYGIGVLGAAKAGPAGQQRLQSGLPGPPTARREAMVKALALFSRS